jgi:hypothetical protein
MHNTDEYLYEIATTYKGPSHDTSSKSGKKVPRLLRSRDWYLGARSITVHSCWHVQWFL